MAKPFLKNAWYAAAWSYEVKKELFERTIIGESILFYRKENNQAVAINNTCAHRYSPLHMGILMGDVVECAYHGLRYDSSGRCVHNPHGDGKIPEKMCTRAYPLEETHNMLWIWMGEPAQANPATIPDFSCHTDPNYPSVQGMIEMHGNYELITDNLMDLSHAEFLHKGILGSDAIKRGQHELLQDGTTVWSNRWCPDGLAPPAWDHMFNDYGKPVDHWLYMRWDAPCHMLLDVGVAPKGRPRNEGIWVYGTDILTPKNETSTYYYWGIARSHDKDSADIDEKWTHAIKIAFGTQDKPMIEAQQNMLESLGVVDLDEVDPVLLPMDSATVRCRRVLDRLRREDGVKLPDPRNPALTDLIRKAEFEEYNGKIVPVV